VERRLGTVEHTGTTGLGVGVGRLSRLTERVRQAVRHSRELGRSPLDDQPSLADLLGPDPEPPAPEPVVTAQLSIAARDDAQVPRPLRVGAAWLWRLLVIVLGTAAVLWAVGRLHEVVVPLLIALLLTALFLPAVSWLTQVLRMPRSLAVAMVMIGGLAVIGGVIALVVNQFIDQVPDLTGKAQDGVRKIQAWLKGGPLHLSDKQLDDSLNKVQEWVNTHQSTLTSGALTTATTVVTVLFSFFLVIFSTFFFLRDGRRIWYFFVGLLPRSAREPIANAAEQSWRSLTAYVRATVLVAFIDALGIGIGLYIMRIDLAFPLATLVFLGAFIPIIGATLSGTVAVLVALVTKGPGWALIVLALVIGVQQLEGHVLQPLIMGRAVALHPLAVITAIATGGVLAGIMGALVAVPLVAVLNTGIRHLMAHRAGLPDPPPPDDIVVRA
jgi:predicted PurR-regulated permease PerM